MVEQFLSPKAVFERARQQIAELAEKRVELETKPTNSVRTLTPDFIIGMYHFKRLPLSHGTIAKDELNNLRSCLDQVGYASAIALKSPKLSQTKFPFGDTQKEAEGDATRRSRDLHPDIIATMLAFKPWKDGNELLWNLNKARNVKEHRALIPVGLGTQLRNFQYRSDIPAHSLDAFWSEKDHALCFPFLGKVGVSQVQIKFDLHLGDVGTLAGQPAIATLNEMASVVENIIKAIERKTSELL